MKLLFFLFIILLIPLTTLADGVWMDFDNLPVTASDAAPTSGGGWTYSVYQEGGYWQEDTPYTGSIYNFFRNFTFAIPGSTHLGLTTFGYPEIVTDVAMAGNSLRFYVSGGEDADNVVHGTDLADKASYLLAESPDATGEFVGAPYFYFGSTTGYIPLPEAVTSTRMSVYVYFPSGSTVGEGGSGASPSQTLNVGPFSGDGVDSHWYHYYSLEGEGWAHIIVDNHPQHNNGSYGIYGGDSIREMPDYVAEIYKFYIAFIPYGGISTVPYSIYIDSIEFINDTESQNNETINSPAIHYNSADQTFQISFNDKYKNVAQSFSTYELRYSFSQITNANWSSATPAHITADNRFGIDINTDGKFAKWWPYYARVWAPFELASQNDTDLLTSGTTIYFAIKDISQVGGNTETPVTACGVGNWSTCGRDYNTYPDSFDFAGDEAVLNLIKRIDYTISGGDRGNMVIAAPSATTGNMILGQ